MLEATINIDMNRRFSFYLGFLSLCSYGVRVLHGRLPRVVYGKRSSSFIIFVIVVSL